MRGLFKGEVPEAADRAAGEALRVSKGEPVVYRNPDLSFGESKVSQQALTSMPNPAGATVQAKAQRLAEAFGGFFEAQPGLPKDVQKLAKDARWRSDAADAVAHMTVKDRVLNKLQGSLDERVAKAELLQRLIVNTDDLATMERRMKANPDGNVFSTAGRTWDQVAEAQRTLVGAAGKHPDVVAAYQGYRALIDEMFDNYVKRGYISPDRQLADYTPFVKIEQMNEANGRLGGSGAKRTETVLSQLKARSKNGENIGLRHTGALRLVVDQLGDFQTKAAEDDMLAAILNDKTLNRSEQFGPDDPLPAGWVRYRPEPGMPGYGVKDKMGNAVAGFVNTIAGSGGNKPHFYGWVLPERVVRFLNEFHPANPPEMQSRVYKASSALARQMTVYNISNTALNVQGDLMTALLGRPGEKAQPLGILSNYFKAADIAIKGILKGENGPEYEKALSEGVTTGTFASTIGGAPMDMETAKLLGEQIEKGFTAPVRQALKGYRQVVEATPRIAAGMAAEKQGKDFGEAARFASLEFGFGSPAHTRNATFRFMFPFWQFMGLASKRVFDLATTKGSRARTLAALAIPPVATMLWNTQNQNYTTVENSLPKYYGDLMHVIVPDPRDPSKPLLDTQGRPVVVPMRWLVTEQVAQMFGLGNIAERVRKVAVGRDTLPKFAYSIPGGILEQVQQQAVALNIIGSVASGKDQLTGEARPRAELVAKALPLGRDIVNTYKAAKNYGAAAVGQTVVQKVAGVTSLNPLSKGKRDAGILDLIVQRNDARKKMRSAYRKGDRVEGDRWKAELKSISEELKSAAAARKRGQ
jgi:hypothetical protein